MDTGQGPGKQKSIVNSADKSSSGHELRKSPRGRILPLFRAGRLSSRPGKRWSSNY